MIRIQENNFYTAVRKAYEAIDHAPLSMDPDIYREDTAVIAFDPGSNLPELIFNKDKRLRCVIEQEYYFPYGTSMKIAEEEQYWNEKLISKRYISSTILHLSKNINSRSCLFNFWDNEDFSAVNPKGACITQIYLRNRNGCLEMHSHSRANDVHRCLTLDLAYLIYAHKFISTGTGLVMGKFVHFVDSLHIYNKNRTEFEEQLSFMNDPRSIWSRPKIY